MEEGKTRLTRGAPFQCSTFVQFICLSVGLKIVEYSLSKWSVRNHFSRSVFVRHNVTLQYLYASPVVPLIIEVLEQTPAATSSLLRVRVLQ